MSKHRKPRSDSKLDRQPEDVQRRIADWCQQDGLESACSRCAAELTDVADGTPLTTNRDSMSKWFRRWQVKEKKETLREMFERADANAKAMAELLRKELPGATPETLTAAEQMIFTLQAAQSGDAKEFREMEYLRVSKEMLAAKIKHDTAKLKQADRKIAQKGEELKLAERRVSLLEENAAKAKQHLEAIKTKGGLTPETLAQIEQAAAML